ncbi:MAG: TolC family protein [Verrucomicrobia bacterium]|nr:TolC family protein [Verrucomicrobiota bacterium]
MKSFFTKSLGATVLLLLPLVTILEGLSQDEEILPKKPTLTDYIRVGIANNPGLRAEYENYQAALEQIPQAKSLPDPKFSATSFVRDVQTRTGPQRNQLAIGQTFPWFGKLRLSGEIASKEAQAIYHLYENSLLYLHRDISVVYYDYAYLSEATKITKEIIALLERLEPSVQEKVRVGGDLAPLLRLQVEIGRNHDVLQALGKERVRQSAKFDALLDRKGPSLLPWPKLVDSKGEGANRTKFVEALFADNPELKAIETRIDKAKRAVKLSTLSPIPDPTIGANYFDTGSALNPGTPGSGDDPWGIQISFKLPLWFGKYKAEKKQAQANQRMVEKLLENRQNTLVAELERALEDMREAEDRIALYNKTLLPAARQAVEVSEESYKADRATILDVIDSERTLLELEKTYWRAVANRYSSRIRLETLVGRRTE